MITLLPVDPAYAYDYLAILMVKSDKGLPVYRELEQVEQFLKVQHKNHEEVMCSYQFNMLYKVNLSTFDAVDKAWKGKISARKVQEVNQLRFKYKQALQAQYWPTEPIGELKVVPKLPKSRKRKC